MMLRNCEFLRVTKCSCVILPLQQVLKMVAYLSLILRSLLSEDVEGTEPVRNFKKHVLIT